MVSSNLASSSKISFPRSNTTSGGEGRRLKSSSLKSKKKEIREANFGSEFVSSFAEFLMRDQEGEKERTRRNLQKRLRKSATIKAKKLPNIRKINLMT